jgi:hypothetical protein
MRTILAALLVVSLAGCHGNLRLDGTWGPSAARGVTRSEAPLIVERSRFDYFWGAYTPDLPIHIDRLLQPRVGEGLVEDLSLRDHLTVLGFALQWLTIGIVSHREIEVRGRIVSDRETPSRSPAERTAPAGS